MEVKIKKSEWKAKLQKMRAQIQGMKNNVYNGDEDWERMHVIEPPFIDKIMETPLPPRFRLPQT